MSANQFTDEELALGQLYRWIEQRANYLRKQKAESVTRQDEPDSAGVDGKNKTTNKREYKQNG